MKCSEGTVDASLLNHLADSEVSSDLELCQDLEFYQWLALEQTLY